MLKTLHCFPPFFGHWHSSLLSDTHYEHSIPVWVAHWPFLCLGLQLRAFRLFEALSPSPVTSNQRMDMPLGDEMALSMGRTHNRGASSSAWQSIPLWFCTTATSIPQQNLLNWASGMPSRRLLLEPQGTLTSEQRGFWKKNERHGPERQVCRVSIWRPQRSVWASCLNSTQVREEPSLSKVSLKLCALGNQQRGWNVGNFPGSLSRHARNQWIDPAHL